MVCIGSLRIKVISKTSPEIVGYVMLNNIVLVDRSIGL